MRRGAWVAGDKTTRQATNPSMCQEEDYFDYLNGDGDYRRLGSAVAVNRRGSRLAVRDGGRQGVVVAGSSGVGLVA